MILILSAIWVPSAQLKSAMFGPKVPLQPLQASLVSQNVTQVITAWPKCLLITTKYPSLPNNLLC